MNSKSQANNPIGQSFTLIGYLDLESFGEGEIT